MFSDGLFDVIPLAGFGADASISLVLRLVYGRNVP